MQPIQGRNRDRLVARGEAVRICHGLYLPRTPTPRELATIVCQRWPDAALDGYSAARHLLGFELHFPLHFLRAKGLEGNQYFHARRVLPKGVRYFDGLHLCSPLQAIEVMEEDHAVDFLEKFLNGGNGSLLLEHYKADFSKFPAHTRKILDRAVIGSDSVPERTLTRALEKHVEVTNNFKIGPYRWDLVLKKHKVAIEVDGYAYHRAENRKQFEVDRQKSNDAVHRGWHTLRFTAVTVETHLEKVVAQVLDFIQGGRNVLAPPWDWHQYWLEEPYGAGPSW